MTTAETADGDVSAQSGADPRIEHATAVKRRSTLRDVAREAGVSLKTASNVINGTGRMTALTRERVEAVIKSTGYRVNVAARNLNRDHTGFITLAVPSLTPPYLAELANRTIDAARQLGFSVYVTTYAEGSAKGARDLLQSFNSTVSDGMILSMSEVEDITADDLTVDFPLVVVGARTTWGRADHVTPDDVQAASTAAAYLFDHGSRSLAVIGAREVFDQDKLLRTVEGNAELRLRGIVEECMRRGVLLNADCVGVTRKDWTIGSGARTTQQLIDAAVPFDGIVALNDQLAIGALFALQTNGINVPRDVQVIGFDNIEESAYMQIPLTTMDSRLDWTAPTAVERILGRIRGEITHPDLLMTSSRVIERQSTR
ncbi:LacI family DNA-binding transcriptional regulator [Bifidobacterium psychraerophilum]|jgi:DNA-binding LacI/PurR family transcriptional regulator|uniref:LacI family transcriptional regulator n=1 Tax=Bifidobacterium psychraerophilum TaxID=218140 RepID=A0A087CJ85_9BIFI|nr:LacI family DNA-binding transcriptional regulator [Bifidobacterium psychraerophilum]KFI83335.1 LacI family transcriptional regulator [Bifidobacterium psychraerophilum]MCI1660013.1 LacI family transcriptional regulator [Bifidobacterium psychraerophilum]MCI1804641.1 LacI family transcriptional regulator [Bifidobacterium psychraerophilum]MCI2176978.1 LacI family transcriptional regulator [Bifidobacterium psychraerophilum]MCI2181812.1 LacI family transcriptional regulator [Bifidobacterium psych